MHKDRNDVYRGGPQDRPLAEMTREELLWDIRIVAEEVHQCNLWLAISRYSYIPSACDANANRPLKMSVDDFYDTCNKSVPVYISPTPKWSLLQIVLHNYIFRRWLRPYRSEIEYNRFICKFIFPQDLPDETSVSQLTTRSLVGLNRAICSEVDSLSSSYIERRALGQSRLPNGIRIPETRLYILQPLFRALLILFPGESYNNQDSKTVGGLFVYLIRTGVEEGLSAPITFEPIEAKINRHIESEYAVQVTLETAIDFVMSLEARETAAFGLRPDPVAEWKPNEVDVKNWRTVGETGPLIGPSSQWAMDTEKYPWRRADGREFHYATMVLREQYEFPLEARRARREAEEIKRTAGVSDSNFDNNLSF